RRVGRTLHLLPRWSTGRLALGLLARLARSADLGTGLSPHRWWDVDKGAAGTGLLRGDGRPLPHLERELETIADAGPLPGDRPVRGAGRGMAGALYCRTRSRKGLVDSDRRFDGPLRKIARHRHSAAHAG